MNENKQLFIAPYLKGVGQIMLQDNIWTGVLFLAGIFIDSYIMGIAAVIAVVVGTLTARLLKFPEENINMGLYGFSATLVGVSMVTFFQPEPVIWIGIVIGSAAATIFQHFLISKKIPGFTFPFIAVSWVLYCIFKYAHPVGATAALTVVPNDDVFFATHGFGEVIFQASIVAGVLFFIGVFISNPVGAIYGLAGSVISGCIAFYFTDSDSMNSIYLGLFSFNALLCAITFSGTTHKAGILVLIACVLSVLIEMAMMKWVTFMPFFTFPFVAACWLTIPIKKLIPESLASLK
jgi:urea transporter